MTIRNRLKLIGLLPITILILLSSYFFITSYMNYEKANALKLILTNNAKLTNLLTETGKERDLTAMYIASEQKEFKDALTKQRQNTNQAFTAIQNSLIINDTSYLPIIFELLSEEKTLDTQKYQYLLREFKKLPAIRKNADSPNADFKTIFFDGYTKSIATPLLDNLLQINNFALNSKISSLITTLSQLYIAKENSGLERGLISYYMSKKASMSFEEISLWDKFKTKANIFKLTQVNDVNLRTQLDALFQNTTTISMLKDLAETSSAIQTDVDNGDYAEEVIDWFALQTQKISLL